MKKVTFIINYANTHRLIFALGALIALVAVGATVSTALYHRSQVTDTGKYPAGDFNTSGGLNGTPKSSDSVTADKGTQTSPQTDDKKTSDTKKTDKPQNKENTSSPSSKTPNRTLPKPTENPLPSIPSTPTKPEPTTPSPAPVIPKPPVLQPSGQSVPKGNFGVWKHIFYDDFTKNAALGSWGEDWDAEKIVYTGAQGQKWRAYPKSYKDTYNKRPYRSDQVLSVKNSLLNFWLHNVDGQPAGANPSPVITGSSQYQTYGRYSTRFKVDTPNLNDYYVAWLLWPQSERWPQDGEMDFPEGNLAGGVGGFHHYSGAGSCTNGCQDVANIPAGTKFTDWHTYTIEWMPGRVRYILDDKIVLDSTKWVPSSPMRWQLQTETGGNGNSSGNLMVDWVSVWSYSP